MSCCCSGARKRILPDKQVIVQDEEFLNTLTSTEREEFCELAVIANEYTYKRFKEEIKPGLDVANDEFIERLQKNYSLTMDFQRENMKIRSFTDWKTRYISRLSKYYRNY